MGSRLHYQILGDMDFTTTAAAQLCISPLNRRMAVPIVLRMSPHANKLRLGATRFHAWTVCHRYHSGGRASCGPLVHLILVRQARSCASKSPEGPDGNRDNTKGQSVWRNTDGHLNHLAIGPTTGRVRKILDHRSPETDTSRRTPEGSQCLICLFIPSWSLLRYSRLFLVTRIFPR
jgi:cytochrome c2